MEIAREDWGALGTPWRPRIMVWQGQGISPSSRATSRRPEAILLQLSLTFSRLGNRHPVIGCLPKCA